MKIITWNCNMAFRKKAHFILEHNPDVLVIQECEHPDKLFFSDDVAKPNDVLWFGQNFNKGLAVFSYNDFHLTALQDQNDTFRHVIPISVTSPEIDFNLFAVWANNPSDKDGAYIEQVWKAVAHYDKLLINTRTILIGDFNSNKFWDRKGRLTNHENLVNLLEQKGIFSTYHVHHKQLQGLEAHPTLYMYRHENKPYHLDYCFASEDMVSKIETLVVGDYNFWKIYSDHMPLIIAFSSNCS